MSYTKNIQISFLLFLSLFLKLHVMLNGILLFYLLQLSFVFPS